MFAPGERSIIQGSTTSASSRKSGIGAHARTGAQRLPTPRPSIRWSRSASRWCAGRRRCVTDRRPTAAWSMLFTGASRRSSRAEGRQLCHARAQAPFGTAAPTAAFKVTARRRQTPPATPRPSKRSCGDYYTPGSNSRPPLSRARGFVLGAAIGKTATSASSFPLHECLRDPGEEAVDDAPSSTWWRTSSSLLRTACPAPGVACGPASGLGRPGTSTTSGSTDEPANLCGRWAESQKPTDRGRTEGRALAGADGWAASRGRCGRGLRQNGTMARAFEDDGPARPARRPPAWRRSWSRS